MCIISLYSASLLLASAMAFTYLEKRGKWEGGEGTLGVYDWEAWNRVLFPSCAFLFFCLWLPLRLIVFTISFSLSSTSYNDLLSPSVKGIHLFALSSSSSSSFLKVYPGFAFASFSFVLVGGVSERDGERAKRKIHRSFPPFPILVYCFFLWLGGRHETLWWSVLLACLFFSDRKSVV